MFNVRRGSRVDTPLTDVSSAFDTPVEPFGYGSPDPIPVDIAGGGDADGPLRDPGQLGQSAADDEPDGQTRLAATPQARLKSPAEPSGTASPSGSGRAAAAGFQLPLAEESAPGLYGANPYDGSATGGAGNFAGPRAAVRPGGRLIAP